MPPRKRARLSQAASPVAQATTPEPAVSSKPNDADVLDDPWTDEEEIGLFKGLIRWKPTGMHKHFRMLQLREYLLDNNHIHHKSEHTQIAGIWQKLHTLFDLEALDQREDARQLSDISDDDEQDDDEEMQDDAFSTAENKLHRQAFELPEEDYGEDLWSHRLASSKAHRDESPPILPELNLMERAPVRFTASFSIEPEDLTTRRAPRHSRGAAKAKPATMGRRSKRKTGSVADSEEPASEEEEQVESQAEGSEEADEEEEEEDEATSETSAPTTRGRGKARGRGTARGRPRGRRR